MSSGGASCSCGDAGRIALSPVELLVFQGTPFCNIDCGYCYLPDRSNRSRLSLETVRATCRGRVRHRLIAEKPIILWHSGEPLVLPVAFYEAAFAAIEAELPGLAVQHSIQTNATLIDARWIDVFKRWQITVGVSLDGPPSFHDRHRRNRSGGPTSDRVLAGIGKLKQAGLPLRIICVLTRDSIEKPDELFAFFESLGADLVCFNIDEVGGPYRRSSHAHGDAASAFRHFLRRYFELVVRRRSIQRVRELTRGLMYVFAAETQPSDEAVPIRTLTVGHDGTFGTFSPDLLGLEHPKFGPFALGNVHDERAFADLPVHRRLIAMHQSIRRGIDACERSCGYFQVGQGGVPANKLGEHGTFEATETLACRFKRQAVADAVVDLLASGQMQNFVDDHKAAGMGVLPGAQMRR
jgi:uncharacterized protein